MQGIDLRTAVDVSVRVCVNTSAVVGATIPIIAVIGHHSGVGMLREIHRQTQRDDGVTAVGSGEPLRIYTRRIIGGVFPLILQAGGVTPCSGSILIN